MTMSPVALEAYLRDVISDRHQAAANAALLAQARGAQPASRPGGSTTTLAAISHLGPFALLTAFVRK
jgi:hypothetical protein